MPCISTTDHEICRTGQPSDPVTSRDDATEAPTQAVPVDGGAHRPPDGIGDPGDLGIGEGRDDHGQRSGGHAASGGPEFLELPCGPEGPDHALRRWRPFSRRDRTMRRPARSDMRWRKPCLRALRRLLGWNVLFILGLLDQWRCRRWHRFGHEGWVDSTHGARCWGAHVGATLEPAWDLRQTHPGTSAVNHRSGEQKSVRFARWFPLSVGNMTKRPSLWKTPRTVARVPLPPGGAVSSGRDILRCDDHGERAQVVHSCGTNCGCRSDIPHD